MNIKSKDKILSFLVQAAPFIALFALFVICCIISPAFSKSENLLNIGKQVTYSGIIALGMTVVIAGAGIDLSVGSLLALCGVLSLQVANMMSPDASPMVVFCVIAGVALLVGLLGGAVNGALVNYGRIPPFIATLGTFSIFRSLAIYRADAGLVESHNGILRKLSTMCDGFIPLISLFLIAGALFFIVRFTKYGWHVLAVGANEKAARYAAINVRLVSFMSYVIIGLLCGIASILFAARLGSVQSSNAGAGYELDAIAAVIIGGTPMTGGKAAIWGTLAGVIMLGMIGNILDLSDVSANLQGTVKGLVIILVALSQYKSNKK